MRTFRNYMSLRRVAWQDAGMGADAEFVELIGPELGLLLPELDEKARRLTLGAVARAAGDGGIGAVARLTGASWQTVADGAAELGPGRWPRPGRVRRPGAGRKRLAETDPGAGAGAAGPGGGLQPGGSGIAAVVDDQEREAPVG